MSEPFDRLELERQGWALESAVARSLSAPETFLIPAAAERVAVGVGQGVKLLFWIQSEEEDIPLCERMWVLVEERLAGGRYRGRLESTPDTPGSLHKGERVTFTPDDIADIYTGPTDYVRNGEPEV